MGQLQLTITTGGTSVIDSVPCQSVSFPDRTDGAAAGAGSGSDTPAAHLSTVKIIRPVDGSSVYFHQAAVRGDSFDVAALEFDAPQQGKLMPISVIDLVDGVVADYAAGGQVSGASMETVTLMFTKMTIENLSSPDANSPMAPGWDLKAK
jgi:type VI protein secretion system component Hcp